VVFILNFKDLLNPLCQYEEIIKKSKIKKVKMRYEKSKYDSDSETEGDILCNQLKEMMEERLEKIKKELIEDCEAKVRTFP